MATRPADGRPGLLHPPHKRGRRDHGGRSAWPPKFGAVTFTNPYFFCAGCSHKNLIYKGA
jgi:hypothetical protein